MSEELLKRLEKPNSRFLVYTSAGNNSQIHRWLKGRKDFDLWITCYAEGNHRLRDWADYYNEKKGGKFPNLHHVVLKWPELIRQYEAIYVSDDDLHISGSGISELFKVRERYDLYILQPALSQRGKISHRVTVPCLFSYLRYTNFVEVNCPLFRTDKLLEFMEVYDPLLICHGVDYWYMHQLVGENREKAAIVDAITVLNPHDLTKGGREILKLQSDEDRLSNWERVKFDRGLRDLQPLRNWSVVRRFDLTRFYASSLNTFFSKVAGRLRKILF